MHLKPSISYNRWRERLSRRTAMLALLISLGWLIRPQPEPDRAGIHVSGEFPVVRPDISGLFPKLQHAKVLRRAAPKPKPEKPKVQKVVLARPRLLLAIGKEYIGARYQWGGNGPRVFDCSGLTKFLYARVGVELPRVSRAQATAGFRVSSLRNARLGDLLFFGSPIHHVAIYVGGGLMLDAPHTGSYVQIRRVYEAPSVIRRVL